MATRQLTQVYLDPEQKRALQVRAKAKGSKVSAEIRSAVDAYLAGITSEELDMLDGASREAEKELIAIARALDATNRKLDAAFAELSRIRAEREQAA